jgi:hypothetical protein
VSAGLVRAQAEDGISRRERRDPLADRLDLPGEIASQDPVPRPGEAREEPDQERVGGAHPAVRPVDRVGVDLDQQLAGARLRLRHLLSRTTSGGP